MFEPNKKQLQHFHGIPDLRNYRSHRHKVKWIFSSMCGRHLVKTSSKAFWKNQCTGTISNNIIIYKNASISIAKTTLHGFKFSLNM